MPDLAAKPIIDMLLVVKDSADENAYVPDLEGAGYTLRIREPAWHEHRMLEWPIRRERFCRFHLLWRVHSKVEKIIHWMSEILFAPKITFRCLNGCMPE